MTVVVAAIIRSGGRILITRRRDNVHLAGLWEFPGGKVEPDETLQSALHREIREELGILVNVKSEFFTTEHHYPTKSVRLHFFECAVQSGEPSALDVAEWRWVTTAELSNFVFPEADAELIARLQNS